MPLINSHRVIDINKGFFICVPAVTNIQNAPFCYRCSFLPPLVSKWTNSIYQRAFRAVELKPHRGSNHIEVLLPKAVATNRAPLLPLWLARVATCQELLEMVCTDCALLPTFFSSWCSKKKKISPPSDAAVLSSSDRMDVGGSRGQAWLTWPDLCMFTWPKYALLATWPKPVWRRRAWWSKNTFCQIGSLLLVFFFLNKMTPYNCGCINFTFSDFPSCTSADQTCVINYPPNSIDPQKTACLATSLQAES